MKAHWSAFSDRFQGPPCRAGAGALTTERPRPAFSILVIGEGQQGCRKSNKPGPWAGVDGRTALPPNLCTSVRDSFPASKSSPASAPLPVGLSRSTAATRPTQRSQADSVEAKRRHCDALKTTQQSSSPWPKSLPWMASRLSTESWSQPASIASRASTSSSRSLTPMPRLSRSCSTGGRGATPAAMLSRLVRCP